MKKSTVILLIILTHFVQLQGQIIRSTSSIINLDHDFFDLKITNVISPTANVNIQIECSINGRPIYQAQTRPVTLNQGMNQFSYELLQPIQVGVNELNSIQDEEKVICEIKLIQNNQIIARERQTMTLNLNEGTESEETSFGTKVKDKFNIQGNINLLGQISDRQGEGSTVPQNFLRSDGRATLSFSHIPIDLSYLLTSEQRGFNQNMNRGTARLNIPLLKQNLRDVVDERIEEAGKEDNDPTESQMLAFKEEKTGDKYPSYVVWKTYFNTEQGRKEHKIVKDHNTLQRLKESPSTKRNIKRYNNLASDDSLTDEQQKEKQMLQELVSHLNKLDSKNNDKLGNLSRPLDDLIGGYNLLKEAEDYKSNLTIDDYKSDHSSFNPFRFLSKTEKILNTLQSVSIGTSAPYFSRLTLSGLLVDGVQIEINPGKIYFSGVYGRSARETFNTSFSVPDLTLSQRTLGLKAGYGGIGETHLHISFVQISDNDSPLLANSGLTKQNNRIIGLDGMVSLLDNNLTLQGELVGSLYTWDSEASSLDNTLRKEVPIGFLYPEANSTSSFDHAYRLEAKWRLQSIGLNVNGNIERLNPNYFSLGAPTLLSNVMRWRVDVRKSLWSNKIQLGVNAARDNNSLNPLLSSINNTTEAFGGDVTLAFPNLPQIFASYAPFAQRSLINETGVEQFSDTDVRILNVTYPYKLGKGIRANTQVGYSNQSLSSNIEGATNSNTTYTFNQNINYKSLGLNAGITHSPDQMIGEVANDISTLSINANYNEGKLGGSVGFQVLQIPDQESKIGYNANINYSITENIAFTVRAQRNLYESFISNPSFNEYYIQSGLSIAFGKEKSESIPYEEKPVPSRQPNTSLSSSIEDNSTEDFVVQAEPSVESDEVGFNNKSSQETTPPVVKDDNNSKKDAESVNPKSKINEEEFTIESSSKQDHYKVLFTVENVPEKSFLSLSSIGPVYYSQVNSTTYFYYIGHYTSEDKARSTLKKIKRSGFADAKILEFSNGELVREVPEEIVEKIESTKPQMENEPIKEQPVIQEVIKTEEITYHILFRVLDNPFEEFPDLEELGPLFRETFDDKGNSRYLIGNTDDLQEAEMMLQKVKDAGFKASFIAEYKNGKLHKILQ